MVTLVPPVLTEQLPKVIGRLGLRPPYLPGGAGRVQLLTRRRARAPAKSRGCPSWSVWCCRVL